MSTHWGDRYPPRCSAVEGAAGAAFLVVLLVGAAVTLFGSVGLTAHQLERQIGWWLLAAVGAAAAVALLAELARVLQTRRAARTTVRRQS